MAQIKLTKTELRQQQIRLQQLQKYLPTLQLKKALLQLEVNQTAVELEQLQKTFVIQEVAIQKCMPLFSEKNIGSFFSALSIVEVKKSYENIAGVEIPLFQEVIFAKPEYSLFDTPVWYERALSAMHSLLSTQENIAIVEDKKRALEKELRDVSIRVNLFEKILIPRCLGNMKRIKIFLGDQQLAAVSQAKVSKKKILQRALHDH